MIEVIHQKVLQVMAQQLIKKAVCQGYTALYNILCKIVGIEVQGVPGIVNGEEHHPLNPQSVFYPWND